MNLVKGEIEWVDKELELYVVHFTESEDNVLYRISDDSRGYSVDLWKKVLVDMKSRYEPPEIDEFPTGTKYIVKSFTEEQNNDSDQV